MRIIFFFFNIYLFKVLTDDEMLSALANTIGFHKKYFANLSRFIDQVNKETNPQLQRFEFKPLYRKLLNICGKAMQERKPGFYKDKLENLRISRLSEENNETPGEPMKKQRKIEETNINDSCYKQSKKIETLNFSELKKNELEKKLISGITKRYEMFGEKLEGNPDVELIMDENPKKLIAHHPCMVEKCCQKIRITPRFSKPDDYGKTHLTTFDYANLKRHLELHENRENQIDCSSMDEDYDEVKEIISKKISVETLKVPKKKSYDDIGLAFNDSSLSTKNIDFKSEEEDENLDENSEKEDEKKEKSKLIVLSSGPSFNVPEDAEYSPAQRANIKLIKKPLKISKTGIVTEEGYYQDKSLYAKFGQTYLYYEDFVTLNDNTWLSDLIVDVLVEIAVKRKLVVKDTNIFPIHTTMKMYEKKELEQSKQDCLVAEKGFLVMPFYHASHFTLAIANFDEKKFLYFDGSNRKTTSDSVANTLHKEFVKLRNKIIKALKNKEEKDNTWVLEKIEKLIQTDAHSCGILVYKNVLGFFGEEGYRFTTAQQEREQARNDIITYSDSMLTFCLKCLDFESEDNTFVICKCCQGRLHCKCLSKSPNTFVENGDTETKVTCFRCTEFFLRISTESSAKNVKKEVTKDLKQKVANIVPKKKKINTKKVK